MRAFGAEGLPFPAVTRGQERIRFRVRSCHTEQDIDKTLSAVERVLARHSLLPARKTSSKPGARIRRTNIHTQGPGRIIDLAIRSSRQRDVALPWISGEYYEKIVNNEAPWKAFVKETRWFTACQDDQLVTVACAGISSGSDNNDFGFIGDIYSTGDARSLHTVLGNAVEWLRPKTDNVLAPIHVPLQVLGGGILTDPRQQVGPFLEPSYTPALVDVLHRLGAREAISHTYALARLQDVKERVADKRQAPANVTFRSIDRSRLNDNLALMLPLFNKTVGHLPFCTNFSMEEFNGIASELRDLNCS